MLQIRLLQRWTSRMATGQRKTDPSGRTVHMQNHLVKSVSLRSDVIDLLDREMKPPEPRVQFSDERPELLRTPDATAYRVVYFGRAGE